MLVTKHAAELCALLVNDLYGELPSRILFALFTRGRSNVPQLAQQTSLGPRHVRNGLAVLVQHNLIFHQTEAESSGTNYDANADACYNLLRLGKTLDIIETRYGDQERDLVQMLLLLGHARVADLARAVESRAAKPNGHLNGVNGGASSKTIDSVEQLEAVLARLIQADIIEAVQPDSFRVPLDVYDQIEKSVKQTAPGAKISKTTADQQQQISEQFRRFRDQGKTLKSQLDGEHPPASKRRKLENGNAGQSSINGSSESQLNAVVRINPEKCLVEQRNQRLAEFAADTLGLVTGEVYRVALEILTEDVSRCRADAILGESTLLQQTTVTTLDIFDRLDEAVNVQSGIGRAPRDKIDVNSAERVQPNPPGDEDEEDEEDVPQSGSGRRIQTFNDVEGEEDTKGPPQKTPRHAGQRANGQRSSHVTFDDDASAKDDRLHQMRQHLLLLSESEHRFLRLCGRVGRGQWTVDFKPLMDRLREKEMDAVIEQSFGRHGLRLTRILRARGKLDEKMLPSAALMKKSDVQGKMLAMQMAGLVDVQEVPKDSMRLANRTLFFWFFDAERVQSGLLDDIYKAILRCLQTLQVERHKQRDVLSFVERKDVQGKEEELMGAEHYNKYNEHLEIQEKLLGQVMRLDDMVGVLRDF